jgi:hypothetical protein
MDPMKEMRRLAGLEIVGEPPATWIPATCETVEYEEPALKQRMLSEQKSVAKDLAEGRLTLFKDGKKLKEALGRARSLIQRAIATVQQDSSRFSSGQVNERMKTDMYRLDQELTAAVESLFAAEDAFDSVESGRKVREEEEPEPQKEVEVAYRVPGAGGWKRKKFPSNAAAVKWLDKLIAKEGDDIEVRWARD